MPDQVKQPDGSVVDPTRTLTAQQADAAAHPVGITHESGLLSNLPANGSRVNNSTYFATDQNGGTTYRMVSGAWVQSAMGVAQSGGRELAFAAASAAASGTTVFDVTGCTITFTVTNRPVYVTALVPLVTSSAANGAFTLTISDNANTETAAILDVTSPTAGNGSGGGNQLLERISVPGTYTRKLRAQTGAASAGATTTVAWTATRAAHIKAVEA